MDRGMKSFFDRTGLGATTLYAAATLIVLCLLPLPAFAQTQPQARRLILKDGTYQTVTKYQVQGDRVRYYSAERGEWEEVPKSLIDWDATEKFEQGREAGKIAPEAAALDKELEAEREAEKMRSPQVAPALRLPDEGGIFLLDTYDNQPQIAELQQSGGDLDKNTKTNILRAMINPMAGSKQTIELPGPHSKIQSHTTIPSLYINIESNDGAPATAQASAVTAAPLAATDRYRIIRVETKGGKRVAGAVKVAVTGKASTDERLVPVTATPMTGGWIKLTPADPLASGEYAVAEMLGKDGMNIYVWDFGVNPSAPANAFTWKPEPPAAQPDGKQPAELQKREKQ